ncbi:MAG: hypothetical protein V1838_03865 [Patescibacteria group bacterium]
MDWMVTSADWRTTSADWRTTCDWDGNENDIFKTPQRTFSKVRWYNISHLMQSIKGNFSYQVKIPDLWQKRFYHRIIDNENSLRNTIEYIRNNHIKNGLPAKYSRYPYRFTDRKLIDGLF